MSHQINPALTSIAQEYGNQQKDYIADLVLPSVDVGSSSFKYRVFNKVDKYTPINDQVGAHSQVHEIATSSTLATASVEDYALEYPIAMKDLKEQPEGIEFDQKSHAAKFVTSKLKLNREKRVADLLTTSANYNPSNVATLLAGQQFDNPVSTPVKTLQDIIYGGALMQKPNVMVLGRDVALALLRHADIRGNFYGAGQSVAQSSILSQIFEMEKVLIVDSFINTAQIGLPAVYSKQFAKKLALLCVNDLGGDLENPAPSFGFTASLKESKFQTMEIADPNIGARGGVRIRVLNPVKETIMDNTLGFLINSAIA